MIELNAVSKSYTKGSQSVHALKDVTLRIETGESLALVGPSGSGKSTLLSLLGLMDQPTRGQVLFGGQDTAAMLDAELSRLRGRQIGFVFQAFNLLPTLNAWQNVALPLRYAGVPVREGRARAEAVLAQMGLADRANHRPAELSGGQEQRVAIARALVINPALILADEPTGNFDGASGAQVLACLHDLHRQGTALVLVTHSSEVAAHAGRVLTVRDGRVTEERGSAGQQVNLGTA